MALSSEAEELLKWLRRQYIAARHPNYKTWTFSPGEENVPAFRELRAHGYIEQWTIAPPTKAYWRLTHKGQSSLLETPRVDEKQAIEFHHHGDIVMGTKHTANVTGSTIGALSIGDNAQAHGSVNISQGSLTQEQHRQIISGAQAALVRDQDALERIDERLYEALTQFLTIVRKLQVDQQSMAELQAKMKATLDEIWAEQAAKGMKPQAIPKTLEVIGELAKHPATTAVVKHLVGG